MFLCEVVLGDEKVGPIFLSWADHKIGKIEKAVFIAFNIRRQHVLHLVPYCIFHGSSSFSGTRNFRTTCHEHWRTTFAIKENPPSSTFFVLYVSGT
jgi:hypothetical protein